MRREQKLKNITKTQKKLVDELKKLISPPLVRWDESRGICWLLRGNFGGQGCPPENTLKNFLIKFGPLFGPPNIGLNDFKPLNPKKGANDWLHLTFQHILPIKLKDSPKYIAISGARISATFNNVQELLEIRSSLWRDSPVDTQKKLKEEKIISIGKFCLMHLNKLNNVTGFDKIYDVAKKKKLRFFPFVTKPYLVIYPWEKKFPFVRVGHGYALLKFDHAGNLLSNSQLTFGKIYANATSGKIIVFTPSIRHLETPHLGSGLGVLPISGPISKPLNMVRIDNSGTTTSKYLLKDKTHCRDIITYNFDYAYGCSQEAICEKIISSLPPNPPISEDQDDVFSEIIIYNSSATVYPETDIQKSQQPDVDAHYFAQKQFEWYESTFGRKGWDDDYNTKYHPTPNLVSQNIHAVVHCRSPPLMGETAIVSIPMAYQGDAIEGNTKIYYIAFMDGNLRDISYSAGSHFILAHEYQHVITDISCHNTDYLEDLNNFASYDFPGLNDLSGYRGALAEGLSDVFGILSTEQWIPGGDIYHGKPIRNTVYPRDNTAFQITHDHFELRDWEPPGPGASWGLQNERGSILGHCAYLMAKGGVHQRSLSPTYTRSPDLIPVYGLGSEKTAQIWYIALTEYLFDTIANPDTNPDFDVELPFHKIREACISASRQCFNPDSNEELTTKLAFYAVGLHPPDLEDYGSDVTFLRWGISWDLSRNYIKPCPNYASLDLFINNGGLSEWNALVNVKDSSDNPTQYENTVYCRVRNVGDKPAKDVEIDIEYMKLGTAGTGWTPVLDKDGTYHPIKIDILPAGASNFPDSAQNSPPTLPTTCVKWCIPPFDDNEEVNHFCLRAIVKSSNLDLTQEKNIYNNSVQSNISYISYSPDTYSYMPFMAGNPFRDKTIPIKLQVDTTLPKNWNLKILDNYKDRSLKPGETIPIKMYLKANSGADKLLEMPLDGDLIGKIFGRFSGDFTGSLTNITIKNQKFVNGRFSGLLSKIGFLTGKFDGIIDLKTGKVNGTLIPCIDEKNKKDSKIKIDACLRPWRRINISQWLKKELLGGLTIQIQIPWNNNVFNYKNPPTDTKVVLKK